MDYLKQLPGKINLDYLNEKRAPDQWEKGYGPQFKSLLENLPEIKAIRKCEDGIVKIVGDSKVDLPLAALKSWRKGPFEILGTHIETEWRSDFKWDRLKEALPNLEGKVILDIGANNGYFMYRMLEHNPKFVLGIEPMLLYKTQFELINHFVKDERLKLETFGVEHLGAFENTFDVIFSMGILYHHRSPLQQLFDMRMALQSGGTLVLETIGIPGDEAVAITPQDRYAGMRNIWLLPTLSMLEIWLEKSKFVDIKIISKDWNEADEQRATEWSNEISYKDFLDPNDSTKTIEGYPAPRRFILTAKKK